MKRPSGPTIAALVCAVLVGLLYVSPILKDVVRTGLDWPIWIDHPEGLMDTSLGKWWVLSPHRYLVDGSSGEFPIYYQSLSDSILNLIAEPLGIPAMTVQAVLFGPFLGFAFLLLNYFSIAAVASDRRVALAASLLISLGGNTSFLDRLDPASGLPLNSILHVPFRVISLATAQSLGWVLVLPCLSLTFLAYRRFSRTRALGAGVLLAALFHSHTLTFLNVAAAQLFYFVLVNALERPRDRRFRAWVGALALLAATFVVLAAARPSLSFTIPVALGGLALAATFLVDPNKRFYLWSYGAAGILALPYVLLLARHARALAALQRGWDGVQMMTVGLSGFALFFAAFLLAAAAGFYWSRDRPVLIWAGALLASTAFLAVNHLWHWGNHPYRFAIHMLFPLAILAALALRDAPRPLAAVLGAWLGAVCVFDAGSFALGHARTVRFRVADPERAAFLATVREVTSREEGRGTRLLLPVELVYPRGLVQATTLMNYSRLPSFVPDYRHALWPERYENRMGLFCFLFPGYPNEDYPFGRRACDEALDPEPALLTIREPRLRSAILPVYRIGYAAALGKPFSSHLERASPSYGWPVVTRAGNGLFLRTDPPNLPGLARLTRLAADAATLRIGLTPDAPGPHLLVLGGRRLAIRAPRVLLDGRRLESSRRSTNWAVFEADLSAGAHVLELPSHEDGPDPEAEYLYFAAAVRRDLAARYVALAVQGALEGAARGTARP
jgi:hypothetical protein